MTETVDIKGKVHAGAVGEDCSGRNRFSRDGDRGHGKVGNRTQRSWLQSPASLYRFPGWSPGRVLGTGLEFRCSRYLCGRYFTRRATERHRYIHDGDATSGSKAKGLSRRDPAGVYRGLSHLCEDRLQEDLQIRSLLADLNEDDGNRAGPNVLRRQVKGIASLRLCAGVCLLGYFMLTLKAESEYEIFK